ncbi:hypothetical protein BT96DRAFT_1004049 [Gymnopus androsaceus JB14]|uniref:Uncharacterized protein n=1 Tax=Gymnopus androsaceus JB14 TaxID=1447944 RepID=A0A6A4GTU1_9AGAR|nr:hypothetical protein BT96DRAFT_1004049 [Gymnopus androsaceus JB14]
MAFLWLSLGVLFTQILPSVASSRSSSVSNCWLEFFSRNSFQSFASSPYLNNPPLYLLAILSSATLAAGTANAGQVLTAVDRTNKDVVHEGDFTPALFAQNKPPGNHIDGVVLGLDTADDFGRKTVFIPPSADSAIGSSKHMSAHFSCFTTTIVDQGQFHVPVLALFALFFNYHGISTALQTSTRLAQPLSPISRSSPDEANEPEEESQAPSPPDVSFRSFEQSGDGLLPARSLLPLSIAASHVGPTPMADSTQPKEF